MSKIPVRVLVTCAGGPGQFPHFEALKASDRYDVFLVGADFDPSVGGLFLPQVDRRYRIPACDSADFVPALSRLIEREGIQFWYSGLDEELPEIARHRETFAALGCRVLLPGEDALRAAWDKEASFRRLDGRVRMPRTWALDEVADGDAAALYADLDGQVLVKVAASRGGRDISLPETAEEFAFYLARARRKARETGARYLVQERIVGSEFNVSSLHDPDGGLVYAVSRRKFESRPVKSSTTAARIERRQDVIDLALAAVDGLSLKPGFNNVEIIVAEADDRPYFIEVNGGRTAAQDQNLVSAGINLGDLFLDLLRGGKVAAIPHPPDGLASLKIRKDVITHRDEIDAIPAA